MAEDALKIRRSAQTRFTQKENEFFKVIAEKKGTEILKRKFDELTDAWSTVEGKHVYLRAAVCKYREFAIKTENSKSFIFSQKKPFGETFSKITIKVSEEFSFSRKPAKSEMLPHAI